MLDSLNFRVHRLNEKLEILATWGELGDGSGHFAIPKGLAVDDDGNVWVSDAGSDRIQIFDASGRLLLVVGSRGDGTGEFWNPAGLAVGPGGLVAVADSGNGRVQLLRYQKRKAPR